LNLIAAICEPNHANFLACRGQPHSLKRAKLVQKSRPPWEGRQDATHTIRKLDFLEHDLESGYRFSGCSNNLPKRDSDRALVLAVLLGVVPARLYVMMLGVAGMAVGGVRMMRGLLMIAGS
jgi:hypothetical protein